MCSHQPDFKKTCIWVLLCKRQGIPRLRVLFALTQQCLLDELPFPAHFRIRINYDCFNVIILAEAHINRTDNLPRIISHMISSSLNNGSNTHCHTHCRKDLQTYNKPNSIINTLPERVTIPLGWGSKRKYLLQKSADSRAKNKTLPKK